MLAFLDNAAATHGRRPPGRRHARGPSLLEANADWAAERSRRAGRTRSSWRRSQATDARALVSALVGDALPEELVERIAERSDGNCLFIEELLRTWVSVGTLVPDDAAAGASASQPRRFRSQPASSRSTPRSSTTCPGGAAAGAARVRGRPALSGRRAGAARRATARRRSGAAAAPRAGHRARSTEPLWGEAFAYRHALLRDAGYASLARAERARLHVRLARWLEEAAGDRSTEVAEADRGPLLRGAGERPALAQEIDDGLDRAAVGRLAAEWYERAGQGTLPLSAHDAARQLFQRSIDLTPDESRYEKARRWERLGDATAFAADMDKGAAAYEKSIELYRQAIDIGSRGFDAGSMAMSKAADKMAEAICLAGEHLPGGSAGARRGRRGITRGVGWATGEQA